MASMTFTFSTDWHFNEHGPYSRKDDYCASLFNKLFQTREVNRKVGAIANLCAGDVIDIKAPSRVSHWLVRKLIQELGTFKTDTCEGNFTAIGNHDISYNNLETLEKQPLGVILESGAMTHVKDRIFERDGIRVRVVGVDFTPDMPPEACAIKKGDEDFLIVLPHTYASPTVTDYFGEKVVPYSALAGMDADVFCFGHWHIDQGVEKIGNKTIVNIGSLSRGSLSKDNIFRSPKMALLSFSKSEGKLSHEVKQVKLKVKPAEEIFDLERKEQTEAEAEQLEKFLEKLKTTTTATTQNVETVLSTYDLQRSVRERVEFYLKESEKYFGNQLCEI